MKCVILAGGLGTRISEESVLKPKPMIEIGGKPILWHIMKIYSAHGINDFVVCLGYKGYVIKEYFANYFLHMSDVTFDMHDNSMQVHQKSAEPWRVTLVDTGEATQTGGRLKRVAPYVESEDFCFTYGDGVADVDLKALIAHHTAQKAKATVTAVQPPGRFGALVLDGSRITSFQEKPKGDGGWINGGFFVLLAARCSTTSRATRRCGSASRSSGSRASAQLAAYFHRGFWQPMDTLRDKNHLEELWASGRPPWKTW